MIRKEDYQYIRNLNDFRYLSIEQFDQLVSQMEFRYAKKGQILFFAGDKRDKLFLGMSGYFKVERMDETGNFIYTDFVRRKTIFPYIGLFTNTSYHFSAVALTDVTYYYFSAELYESFSLKKSHQMKHLFQEMSRLLEFNELRMRNMVTSSASERVRQSLAFLLVEMGNEAGELPFSLTTSEIANISGTTRETVSHVLSELKQDAKISIRAKQITYLDKPYFLKYTK